MVQRICLNSTRKCYFSEKEHSFLSVSLAPFPKCLSKFCGNNHVWSSPCDKSHPQTILSSLTRELGVAIATMTQVEETGNNSCIDNNNDVTASNTSDLWWFVLHTNYRSLKFFVGPLSSLLRVFSSVYSLCIPISEIGTLTSIMRRQLSLLLTRRLIFISYLVTVLFLKNV